MSVLRTPLLPRTSATPLPAAYGLRTPLAALLVACALLAGCGSSGSIARRPQRLGPDEVRTTATTVTPLRGLNSKGDDFGVTMPLDTTIVFFTSSRGEESGQHTIYYSRLVASGWGVPSPAPIINTAQSDGTPAITPGGEAIYFTGCDYGFGDCDLYRATVGPRGAVPEETIPWSIPTNLGLRVNGIYWDSQPCISADGSVLYFSSNRPGGFGGRDIWVCRRNADGTWATAINAGERINTSFDEISPWLSPDGQTLFFSSNGRPGMGGYDLYAAGTQPGGTVVEHLGQPINSNADEIAFSLSADGQRAFMASNRSGGEGGYDLYQLSPVPTTVDPLMVVQGSVKGPDGRPMLATVQVTDLTSDLSMGAFTTNPEDGLYTMILPRGYNYSLTAQAPGYLFSSRQVLVPPDLEQDARRRIDFDLQPISGVIRLLVFFPPNEGSLQRESRSDLDRAASFLAANDTVTVEIAGHTDNSGDPTAALALSRERAQAVKSYLVANRISGERIKVVGYGATQPIASNDTEEGRAMNRRVEMRIVQAK